MAPQRKKNKKKEAHESPKMMEQRASELRLVKRGASVNECHLFGGLFGVLFSIFLVMFMSSFVEALLYLFC